VTPPATTWRELLPQRAPLTAGWLAGRFPLAYRAGALRRQRDFFLYVPASVVRRDRVPLLVMLHGCHQDAQSFAQGSRMNQLADEHGFLVLYPQQSLRANPLRCWNWFEGRTRDGAGEPAAIAALARDVVRRYPVDRSRVYLAGMSAGGALTSILAFCYGSLFGACAIVAGMMYRAADSPLAAAQAMRDGARLSPESTADEAVRDRSHKMGFVPALVVQGTHDRVVHPRNAEQIVGQFRRFAERLGMTTRPVAAAAELRAEAGGRSYRQLDYVHGNQLLVRSVLIEGLGHAWSGGDEHYRFNDAALPDTSRLIWDFVSQFRRPAPQPWPTVRLWSRYLGRLLRRL
jgi:poly(hydroxyalkanoate) depolymerase family esterase